MSYGIEIRNQLNQVVLDSTNPAYMLSDATDSVGTFDSTIGRYRHTKADITGLSQPYFIKMEVGDSLYQSAATIFSSRQTLQIRSATPANLLPHPSGYGLVVYNASGEKVFFANGEIILISDYRRVTVTGNTTIDADWVSLLTSLPRFLPTVSVGRSFAHGLVRATSTRYDWDLLQVGSGPNQNIGPFAVHALFAKTL